ncbi:MAG TPA: hypothetical protein IAC62_16985 [Candidatus Pelethocola excrementipullorum]|nr:hypothetical protein [Candidatus Pelethocola excrementipullorum]
MEIIRITLKEEGDSKVILFRKEKQNALRNFASEIGKVSAGDKKEGLRR